MDAREIMESEDFKRCVDFHGHICPGLSIGYKAAKVALEKLNEERSETKRSWPSWRRTRVPPMRCRCSPGALSAKET